MSTVEPEPKTPETMVKATEVNKPKEQSLASKVTGIPDEQLPKGGVNTDRGGVVPDRIG